MWWPKPRPTALHRPARGAIRCATHSAVLLTLCSLLGGCFEPMYAQKTLAGGPALQERLARVGVLPIPATTGTYQARIAVELQNALAYDFNGGASPAGKAYDLKITISPLVQSVIVDITTARPDMQQFGLTAGYSLTEVATGKVVVASSTFARVSFDNPGQQQRFANARGQRDAETRAAKVIADNIKARLASYFVAGT